MSDVDGLFSALADPTRRAVLAMLRRESLSAGDLAAQFPVSNGAMSHHFNILKRAGLIRSERRGQQIVYSLNLSVLEEAALAVAGALGTDKKAKKGARK